MGQMDMRPISLSRSVAQYQPNVASRTTSGSGPAAATAFINDTGSFSI